MRIPDGKTSNLIKNYQNTKKNSLKLKRAKNSNEGDRTEFLGSTLNQNQIIGAPKKPNKTKIYPKKYV
jgi:hypothetical protein